MLRLCSEQHGRAWRFEGTVNRKPGEGRGACRTACSNAPTSYAAYDSELCCNKLLAAGSLWVLLPAFDLGTV